MFIHFLVFCAIYLVIGFVTSAAMLYSLGKDSGKLDEVETVVGILLIIGNFVLWPIVLPLLGLSSIWTFGKKRQAKKTSDTGKNKIIDVP